MNQLRQEGWLVSAWDRLPKAEFAIIPLILVVIATAGFLTGMIVGLLAAVLLFVVNYSHIGVVRYAASATERKSTAERHPQDQRLLFTTNLLETLSD